ncbi:MAG: peptidyl-alpha-hydroxyglycine alpha-amidating lyase family protein, partial [Armatimonadota bacterium]
MTFGSGEYTYEVVDGWAQLPPDWTWGVIPAVGCDSRDRLFVYSRSEHPLVLFDVDGAFLASWGEGVLQHAHGIYVDENDNVYCTDCHTHCVRKFNHDGELVMTLGTPGQSAARDGDPFNRPTDLAVASTGEMFVSDGYGNRRVHKFSPDGDLMLSWGEEGTGPGQFALPHCVRVDRCDRVWVCDRENNRLQIFDVEGNFLCQWTDLLMPAGLHFDPNADVVYVAELTQRVSIYTLDGELLARWGGARVSHRPGEFAGGPHGICTDSRGD